MQPQVVLTRLMPPRPSRQTLARPRLTRRLLEAANYKLTILHAGAGYGKTTALALLAEEAAPLVWYQMEAEDADPVRFLLHLYHGFARALPDVSPAPLALLEQWQGADQALPGAAVVDALVNELALRQEPIFLILDDAHVLNGAPEARQLLERLLRLAPPALHVILSTRYSLQLEALVRWRIAGQVMEIGRDELAFTGHEICLLYETCFEYPLSAAESARLAADVEGWPMALPLIWQRLQRGGAENVNAALTQLAGSTGDLFTYLAQEVLSQQPEPVQRFLRETALLHSLDADLCDCVRESNDSSDMLNHLRESGFFVVTTDEKTARYHHLFRDLLQNLLPAPEQQDFHIRAARCYRERGEIDLAIDHFLAGGAGGDAAGLLVRHGRALVAAGRLDQLQGWLSSLSPQVLVTHPTLLVYMGDVARLHSRFEEALGWYQQAEAQARQQRDAPGLGQALRGQARVYLDTVNPSQAQALLEEALRLADGEIDQESQARVLELLAENLLNQGRLEQAEAYRRQAQALRQQVRDESALPLRLLLRTGRLAEARNQLRALASAEADNPVQRPRAHRETLLLLSLLESFMGNQETAYEAARAGTERGQKLESPFITAVGWMRQGHAWLLLKNRQGYEAAEGAFKQAIALSEQLQTPRLRVEASWGLSQAYGFRGQLERAEEVARTGLEIAQQAGDEWVAACIRVTLGAAHVLAGSYEAALKWLNESAAGFRECSDAHGQAVTLLWQCLLWYAQEDDARLRRDLQPLLALARQHDYSFLFLQRTLLGPPEPRSLVPLLLLARSEGIHAGFANALLTQLDLERLELHPGYQLRVQALGPFRLWQGSEELSGKAWTRKKARQLFQLFLTNPRRLLHREQIVHMLWPEQDAETAERDFKIAFNALCRVLEPERRRNAPSAYVTRDGSRYGLRLEADLWYDVMGFDELIAEGDRLLHEDPAAARDRYRAALALYQGDYLQEFPYEEWANQERRRLRNRYLRTAERLAGSLVSDRAWEEAVDVCHTLLTHDNCWEPAYRMLMVAYQQLGNRTQALRIYQQCIDTLESELGLIPSEATTQVYKQLNR